MNPLRIDEKYVDIWKRGELPVLAMQLHMAITGASDPLDDEERIASYIRHRIIGWEYSGEGEFDRAVRQLCSAVIKEYDARDHMPDPTP